jgi:AraC-like DNA-binding protein
VEFAAEFDGLEYSCAELDAPLAAANAELARANDAVVIRYLSRLDRATLACRVQQAILDALPNGAPSKGMIARQLAMSPRNLQRRLAEEGQTFQALLDEARMTLARSYIEEGRLSVTEIAFVLGFADTSAFSRAFKRWTGKSPRAHAAGQSRG